MSEQTASTKNLLLRLDQDLADRLQAVAEVDGLTVSDVVRQAIRSHVDRRRKDPKFRKQLQASIERQRRLLDLLAADES